MTDPPYPPLKTIARNLCCCERTVENLVAEGKLPPPKRLGGKRLWKWEEVCQYIDNPSEDISERIRNAASRMVRGRSGYISFLSEGYSAFHEHGPDDDPRRGRNAPRIPIYPGRNEKPRPGRA